MAVSAAVSKFLQAYSNATPQEKALIEANVANSKVTGVPLSAIQSPSPIISNLTPQEQSEVLNMVAQNQAGLQGMTSDQQQAFMALQAGLASTAVGGNPFGLSLGALSYFYNNPTALQQYATANGLSMQQIQPYVDALTAYYQQPGAMNSPQALAAAAAAGSSGSGSGGPAAGTPAQQDAMAQVNAVLQQYGLQDLASWAWQQITSGQTPAQIMISMYQQPTFQKRFPGIFAMQQAGLAVPNPADYLATENDYKSVLKRYGADAPNDPNAYVNLFTGQVSASELEQRSQMWDKIVNVYGPALQQQFQDYAGINNVTPQQLYEMMAGLDGGKLAQQYAKNTGTQMAPLTFAHITDLEARAESAYKGEFNAGGMVASGPTAGTEEQTIRARTGANYSTTPVTSPIGSPGPSI